MAAVFLSSSPTSAPAVGRATAYRFAQPSVRHAFVFDTKMSAIASIKHDPHHAALISQISSDRSATTIAIAGVTTGKTGAAAK